MSPSSSSSSSSSPLREQILATARAFTKAHSDPRDAQAIRSFLSAPDFVGRFNQSSLPAHTLGDKTADEYVAWQEQTHPLFESYTCELVDVVVDEAERRAVLYIDVKGRADPKVSGLEGDDDEEREYRGSYVHKIALSEDGKLVKVFESFVDSGLMLEFMGRVAAAAAAAKAKAN